MPTADQSPASLIGEMERFIRRDPARRGLIGSEDCLGPLCAGHLAAAAADLAANGSAVAIVTGFFVPGAVPPAAETDGPPGAVLLAAALERLGMRTAVFTDELCLRAVRVAAEAASYAREQMHALPGLSPDWTETLLAETFDGELTHLIAVERVGPSHTDVSFRAQRRNAAVPWEHFASLVPPEARDRCHNMRGEAIDAHTPALHRLFDELARYRPAAKTIGIGDGGNEIGMGSIPWETIVERLEGPHVARIPCRIATDWTLLAGTSNWGAYALAAAVALLKGDTESLRPFDCEQQLRVIERMVHDGPAVDGVTRRQEPTVDGLPFLTYIQPWAGIRRLLGLPE
ncbi:MAG: glutamate cyclase domain-containing protein [Planctomycetaceae bacterium]